MTDQDTTSSMSEPETDDNDYIVSPQTSGDRAYNMVLAALRCGDGAHAALQIAIHFLKKGATKTLNGGEHETDRIYIFSDHSFLLFGIDSGTLATGLWMRARDTDPAALSSFEHVTLN